MSRMGWAMLLGIALVGSATPALAQRPAPPQMPRPATPAERASRDSARAPGDSAAKDSLPIRWFDADSVMKALMARDGYLLTRYQADTVSFDARRGGVELRAGTLKNAGLERSPRLIVSDSVIRYDSTGMVDVRSKLDGLIVMRDSGSTQLETRSSGQAEYNLRERSGRATNTKFQYNEWFVALDVSSVQLGDSARQQDVRSEPTLYGRGGTLTSCDEADHPNGPHYHFRFKEFKRTGKNTLVVRPAVLYIEDIPVAWLPFVFQDMRKGRRSGIIQPRFGVSDIVRNSPNYRRSVEDIGYYFALNDFMDAQIGLDWRSGSGGESRDNDPGFLRYKAEWRYRWLTRFVTGSIAADHTRERSGSKNLAISWQHQQEFSRNSSLTTNVNWAENTRLQQQNTFNPYATLATISSSANYQHKLGPATISLGGTRKQYPGRKQVDQTLPTLSFSTGALKLGEWLTWTPSLNYSDSRVLNTDQAGATYTEYLFDTNGAVQRDSAGPLQNRRLGNSRTTTATFETPLQLFGYDLRNAFRFSDIENDFPRAVRVYVNLDDTVQVTRTFRRTFRTDLDWTPSFGLPSFSQGRWNFSPSVSLQNVDPSPFAVRTELSGGRWVTQKKRPTFNVGVSPTFYGLLPGFGPFSRFRHALSPTMSWSFARRAEVDTSFLRAIGRTTKGYLGSLPQNSFSLGFNTNIEAKVRSPSDTNPEAGEKLTIISAQFSPLSYDLQRAKELGSSLRGLTTGRFNYSLSSDLLPGVSFDVDYSLFEGDPATSDTARFDPYREGVGARFQISRESNPFAVLARIFGRPFNRPATPGQGTLRPQPGDTLARRFAAQPVAGSGRRTQQQLVVPPTQGWQASIGFSSNRQRPIRGGNVIETDPFRVCEPQRTLNRALYDLCVAQVRGSPATEVPLPQTTLGGPIIRQPPTTTLNAQTSFSITQKWSASWQTTYDFVSSDFASHIVSLQRELHDWNAVFAFTQAPNGNFAFNFFIALKAQPDLKLDYSKASYRAGERR